MYGIPWWHRTAPNTALNTTEQRRTPPTGRTVVTSNVGHNDTPRGNALLLDTRPRHSGRSSSCATASPQARGARESPPSPWTHVRPAPRAAPA